MSARRLFRLLELRDPSPIGRLVSGFILLVIAASVVMTVLESDPAVATRYEALFLWLHGIFGVIFTVELVLRVALYGSWAKPRSPFMAKLRYFGKPLNLLDAVALLPFLVPLFFPVNLAVLRALRLLRILRVLRLHRYHRAMRRLRRVLKEEREEIAVLVGLVMMVLLLASSLLHVVEREAQPDKYGSISGAMWWAVSALTTVGYGDVAPITPLGWFLASIIQILGIGVFALPAGVLAARLSSTVKGSSHKCPHCGRTID